MSTSKDYYHHRPKEEKKQRTAEMYHFVKSDRRRTGSGGSVGAAGNSRLFVQATREADDRDNIKDYGSHNNVMEVVGDDVHDLQAVYTSRRITTDVEGSSQHSSKMARKAGGTKCVTTRIVRKTTTVTRGEEKSSAENLLKSSDENSLPRRSIEKASRRSTEHSTRTKRAKISDIVVGEEPNVSAKEALLKWARRSTNKYPGVRVADFTSSWKDGLAFNAIIHRNRPDLVDWRSIRTRTVRERLETAFYTAEREYGVTRLLDPEDVDTHEIDEKSIITYISSLYDVFPEPPVAHPLYDSESQQKVVEYREIAASLHLWMREKLSVMSDRNFPSTLIEMKKLASESNRFRVDEVPPRHRDKQRLQHLFRDLQKYYDTVGEIDLEPELHIDVVDRNWNRLMMAHQERDVIIQDEIKRLERLQRLAEKVHREIKRVDTKLDDVESKINDEARRLERLHPLDAKNNVDILEQELRTVEENIQSLFSDVHVLRDGKYPQSSDLQKRVEKLHQRWVSLRSLFHSRLIAPLSSMSFPVVEERIVTRHTSTILETRLVDTNPHFRNLQECIDWCSKKLKQLQEAEYGSDLPGVQAELTSHLREHKAIEQFHSRAEQCINAKSNFHGEELTLYMQYLNTLQKIYTELLTTSNKRLSDLETLQDFLQSATNQLVWLNEKEEIELTRDWSDRDLNLVVIQQYYETLMSELEKREIQFSAVQDRGESLLLQHHPASKCIEAYMTAMSNQWSWILQLTICLETHLKHASYYQQFFKDVKEAEIWINKRDELLNTVYSQSDFTLDEGERLLKGMQELKEELNQYGEVVASLGDKAQNVVPLKQRRQPITRPMPILAICNYKQANTNIEKGDQWVLHDNSGRIKWRVSSGANGSDCNVPGVVFLIPPPDKEALEAVERLKRQFDRSVLLWQRKQLRMRQNMIFSTIKVVRSWDLAQFLKMGSEQHNAIRKALNEDAAKLLEEGDPTDPQLRRLRREMDEVNKLFDEFEERARLEEESKNAIRIFNEQAASLQTALGDAEHILNTRLNSPIAKDIDSLEHLVIQHKDFETRLKGLIPEIEAIQETHRNIVRKTPALQNRLDRILKQWDTLWNNSNIYIDRLKSVETVLNGLDEANQVISDFEIKLAAFREMPSDIDSLKSIQKDLLSIQKDVQHHEPLIEQLMKDGLDTRRLVETSRHHIHRGGPHHDLDRLDSDLNKVNARWNNVCTQLVDRLSSCKAAIGILDKLANSYQNEVEIIEESYHRLPSTLPITIDQIEPVKTLYKTVLDRTKPIEQINIDGGKFIREAKIYDLRLHHYCEWLIDQVHPGLETSISPNGKRIRLDNMSGSGEAAVSHDLDVLNNRFQGLLSILHDHLNQMIILYPENIELKEFVTRTEPKPLRTFRTELSIYEKDVKRETVSSTERVETITWKEKYPVRTEVVGVNDTVDSLYNISPAKEYVSSFSVPKMGGKVSSSPSAVNGTVEDGGSNNRYFSEIRKRTYKMEESGLEPSIELRGIVHPETGELLTVHDAIRLRILDVRTGKIATNVKSKTGASGYISIDEAVRRGLVTPELAEKLLGPCIVTSNDANKTQLSLLEAIQRELVDAERGPMERLKVITYELSPEREEKLGGISISEITKDDRTTVSSSGGGSETVSSAAATVHYEIAEKYPQLSLYDCINHRLVNSDGRIFDRNAGRWLDISTAVTNNIVDPNFREIVDTVNDCKLTLADSLSFGLITATGKYYHGSLDQYLSLEEAKRRRLIIKPLTLKDCAELDILDKDGWFKSPTHRSKVTLNESIENGTLDADRYNSVVDTETGQLLTLSECLKKSVITRNSLYVDRQLNSAMPIVDAVQRGLIYSVSVVPVFDMPAFKTATDSSNNDRYVSLNTALTEAIIRPGKPITYYYGNDCMLMPSAVSKGFVKSEVFGMLNKKIDGLARNGQEQTAFSAAVNGFIDPKIGLVIDPIAKEPVPYNDALNKQLITPEGCATLKSLLAVTLSTQTITKTVIRYATAVHIPHEMPVVRSDVEKVDEKLVKQQQQPTTTGGLLTLPTEGWDIEVAISGGLFDPVGGMFIIPGTDRLVSFEECIKLQILNPRSAFVVDPNKQQRTLLPIEKSLEKRILDVTGHYRDASGDKCTMKDAIEKSLLIFQSKMDADGQGDENNIHRVIRVTKVDGKPDVVHVSAGGTPDDDSFTEVVTSPVSPVFSVNYPDHESRSDIISFERVEEPGSAVKNSKSPDKSDVACSSDSDNQLLLVVADAVKTGNCQDTLRIKNPKTNVEIGLAEAISSGVVEPNSQSYVTDDGTRISLKDAVKAGLVFLVGGPLLLMSSRLQRPEVTRTEPTIPMDIEQEEEKEDAPASPSSSLAQLTRSRVTTEPKYLVTIGKAKSVPVVDGGRPAVLMKRRLKPSDAVKEGFIDESTANALENTRLPLASDANPIDALKTSGIDVNSGRIVDGELGRVLNVKEAVQRGIVEVHDSDLYLLLPKARSLSVPELRERRLIGNDGCTVLHPTKLGQSMSLREAIDCGLANPSSRVKIDGAVITLGEAVDAGKGDLLLREADNRDRFLEENSDIAKTIPALGLSLEVAEQNGLYDPLTRQAIHPASGERKSLDEAIKEGIIITEEEASETANDEFQLGKITCSELSPLAAKKSGASASNLDPVLLTEDGTGAAAALVAWSSSPEGQTTTSEDDSGTSVLCITKHLTPKDLSLRGVYDMRNQEFLDPSSGDIISFENLLLHSGMFNVDEILVKNLYDDVFLPIRKALEFGMVDRDGGFMTDPQTGKNVSFFEAVKLGWIIGSGSPTARNIVNNVTASMTLEEAVEASLFDVKTCSIIEPVSGKRVKLNTALISGIIEPDSVTVRDPANDSLLSLMEAIDSGIINLNLGVLYNAQTNDEYDLVTSFRKGYIFTDPRRSVSLVTIVTNPDTFDEQSGLIHDRLTGDRISLEEAIKRQVVDCQLTECVDTQRNRYVTLDRAFESELIADNRFRNTVTNELLPLESAVLGGFVRNRSFNVTLLDAVRRKYYDPKKRTVFNPFLGVFQSVRDARSFGFIEWSDTRIKDALRNTFVTVDEAIAGGIFDADHGLIVKPVEMNLNVAANKGYIVPAKTMPVKKDDVETSSLVTPNFANNLDNSTTTTTTTTIVKINNRVLSYEYAVEEGIIILDGERAVVIDGGRAIPFEEARHLGILIDVRRPISLEEAIRTGIYDRNSGLFFDPSSDTYLTLLQAIESNLIDTTCRLIIRDDRPSVISLSEAVHSNIIDGKTGRLKRSSNGETITLAEAVSSGYIVPVSRPLPLQNALANNLFDSDTGTLRDGPLRKLTLKQSIEQGIIDGSVPACRVDHRILSGKVYTLNEACKRAIVDENLGLLRLTDRSYNLLEAYSNRFIVPLTKLNLCEAVDILSSDSQQLLFVDYADDSRKNVTLKEAIERGLILPDGNVLVKHLNQLLPLPQAIEREIVDAEKNVYYPNDDERPITLKQAVHRRLIIVDPRHLSNGQSNVTLEQADGVKTKLITALENGSVDIVDDVLYLHGAKLGTLQDCLSDGTLKVVIDERKKTAADNKHRIEEYTLQDAIDSRLLEPTYAVLKNTTTGHFQSLSEAIANGEIDPGRKIVRPSSIGADLLPRYVVLNDDNDTVVYAQKPIPLSTAIDKGYLNLESGQFVDPISKRAMPLKDAIMLAYIDPDSALVKDRAKRRLFNIAEAYAKGVIDSDKNTVLDTSSNHLYSFPDAMKANVITCRGLTLPEALDFGLYNPVTGMFYDPLHATNDPFKRRKYTLQEAVKLQLIDASSILLKDSVSGDILNYKEATDKYILDPVNGKLVDSNAGKPIDFVKAVNYGYILQTANRQAMEEKYRLCDDTLRKLLSWIDDIEDRLANQDVAQEDTHQLLNQINALKILKQEIDSNERPVSSCLDQVRQVVATGSEYLSHDEILNLEKKEKSLRTRYDRVNKYTDKLLRRLLAANEELSKFSNDLNVFTNWMEKAKRILEEKEHSLSNLNKIDGSAESTREFVSDVIAHQADLRFITMAAQKFFDESKEYLSHLNEFRTSLPQRLSHIEPMSSQESGIRSTVNTVTAQYRDLLARVNNLSDKLTGIGTKQKEYRDALNAVKAWLRDAEPRANKVLLEPIAADPNTLEDQLNRAKTINNEFVSQGRLVDNVKQALNSLLRSLDGQITTTEARNLQSPVEEAESKYKQLSDALAEKCQLLDTALVQSQGVQDALDGLLHWLNDAENSLKNLTRPASLHKDRLEDQMREHRVLQSDIDSHRGSVDNVAQSAQELIATASNPRLAKKIETKLRDVTTRFEKLLDKTAKRGEFLFDIHTRLTSFNEQASSLERWLSDALEIIPEATGNRINDLVAQRDSQRQALDQTVRDGKALINNKDVTDTTIVRDKVKALESQWKELNQVLDEKQRLSKLRSEQLVAYEKLRDQVLSWLHNMEIRVNNFTTVAVEMEVLKKQIDELKPIIKEYRDYNSTIDKVNDLGNAFDSHSRPETPTHRKSAVSPTLKRRSLSSLSELTQVQQELSEINNKYSLLGVRLNDRQVELDNVKEELRKHLEHLKSLSQFLDKIQRLLPNETLIPQSKEDADKMAKQIKSILEEMYEKQALLESTRAGVNDLLRRKPTALGADMLHDDLQEVTSRWKDLNDSCKNRIQILEDLKDFHDVHDNLSNWLVAKDKMMTVLGPISSDSRMVQSQVQQVQVLREEFRTQQPQLNHFTNLGESILSRIPDRKSVDGQKISSKLSNIQKRWNDLLSRLDERAESLGAAVDTSREFDAGLARLRDALQNISDHLDDIPLDKEPDEQLRKIQSLERQLEGQRPLLADLEAAGAQLCDVLSDPTSKTEINAKLAAINRQYNNLQKKLDHRKAEIEGSLRDGRQFEASCSRTLGWLNELLNTLSERLLISADRDVLQQQLDHHEPIYRDVTNKEHEIIMLLNKGKDLLARNSQQNRNDTKTLQRDIDKIQQQWDRIRKDTVDRQTRLQTCMEHCRKYYKALENFIPWLSQAENKLDLLRPDTYKRKDVEKQLRELSSFRNDVWKHSGEFENMRTLGESFITACDVDKDIVKQEIAAVKARWDKLNNDLFERTQWLEDTARRLTDFNESLRDLAHSVQRCEDKLASHDALAGSAKDPKMLERIKAVKEEASKLRKPLASLKQTARDLVDEATELGVPGASHLLDDVDELSERLDDLQAKLGDRCNQLQSASTALAQYNERVKILGININALEQELDSMKPPARDVKTVRSQSEDVGKLIKKIVRTVDEVAEAAEAGEFLVDSGFAPDTATTRDQTENLSKQLNKLDERARNRQTTLETILDKLLDFQKKHGDVLSDITQTSEEFRRLKPVGSEVETIKSQQEEFANFRKLLIEPLSQTVDSVNKLGQNLIQSAVDGVNTTNLEKDLEKLNDRWNAFKEKLNDRDRKLDAGLFQSGKFQEALDGLSKWLTDTEEMVANQKPPSADYKVVKAQLQEQKFLNKMLMDRQNSMSSLFVMGNEVAAGADASERKAIERQMHDLMQRFDKLSNGAAQRMDALQQAMAVAKQFQDKLIPVLEWLDSTEKKVKDMELVPTDEEKIQQRIKEHDALHKDIIKKKPTLTELTDVGSNLMALVGEDEATGVADKLQDIADRYTALVDNSDNVGQLLQASRSGLRHLVLTYQDLQAWIESTENRLNKYKVLPVHTEKLLRQMEDLVDVSEDISNKQSDVDSTVDSGLELMKHISNDEAIQLKDKLDSLQRQYNNLTSRAADLLKRAQESLPLVQQFHNSHNRLVDWMMDAESQLQVAEPREDDIARLELDIQEFRPILENINLIGPQLCQMSPGEGAATIEGLVTRDNRRFDAIAEQIQRKAERIHLSKQRSLEVMGDIDELLDWFREAENQLRESEPPSSEPDIIRLQLKEHKVLNDDISSQKGRVRDVLSTAKKVLRESAYNEDISIIREKMEDLKDTMDTVSNLSSDRLGILEQALPLAEHFHQSHADLGCWLDDMERQVAMLAMPALRPDLIAQQQDRNEMFMQSILEHKPLVDKLNKTGEALVRLCNAEEGAKVQDILDSDNARYAALRQELRHRQQALEKALQETSQFSDKLEGMLRALANTADLVSNVEPISAHPPRIREQIDENATLVEDLEKREEAFEAVKKAANDVINKAPNASDPAVKDMKRKLDKLNSLWNDVQKATSDRGTSLEEALLLAERFWEELQAVMATLRDLQDSLSSQEPPAVQPVFIQQQQEVLQEIKAEIDQTKPEVEQCRASGQKLMRICGEPDKPEVKKHIEDLDHAWDNITALFAKREENLINAMEKAMEFHETLQDILEFLDKAENKFAKLGPIGSDIEAVKHQIGQLKQFRLDVDPHMVKVEALNRQAQELTERTSAEQAAALKEPLASVNRRWDDLLKGVVERQRQLENALLRLGQFHHALAELVAWIEATNKTLDNDLKPVAGDTQLLEVELAKLKVLLNDIQAHQSSVDTLNDAGRQLIESSKGTDEASSTQEKLSLLNRHWRDLLQKAADRQLDLEESLRDAQRFYAEIQDLLSWLGEVDSIIAASKPVGGLPETASEQLERFMEIYNELEENRPKVETVLAQGQDYLKKSPAGHASNLQHNLKTLKQRWDNVTARANDKKIKLEIALKEATEFHEALQAFIDWLTNAEKILTNLKPVSRILPTILKQIEEHKAFQKDVSAHREAMLNLDKKGTHLKYFSQKQDVILIKNLLISVQHRWERVVAKSAERTRALDHGYKEAREFHDAWTNLMNWLSETEKGLDELAVEAASIGNDPEKIKQRLIKHREFQRGLSGKQSVYDSTMRMGKALKEKSPKFDEPNIRQMMTELKEKWNSVCSKSVDRQRKLEEALLYCGQFKDALEALLDWLKKSVKYLSDQGPVHGDLDTVTALLEQHRAFEDELANRAAQYESVKQTSKELLSKANNDDASAIRSKLDDINNLWSQTNELSNQRTRRLADALKEAEELHKSVNMLLEWLSDAEMKLRFVSSLPDDEQETRNQLMEHERFMREMSEKEIDKDYTINLAQKILEKAHPDAVSVIKHWITIIQSRWDEVSTWAKQRDQRLRDHLRSLLDLDTLLEELLAWLFSVENNLLQLESEPLPEEIPAVEKLIEEHKEFMESMAQRQHDVDTVCKAKQILLPADRRGGKKVPGSKEDTLYGSSADLTDAQRKQSFKSSRDNLADKRYNRNSPGLREKWDSLPHIGPRFAPKGSKGSEPTFRNSRCKQLWDKWRNVWILAWERQRRLQERLDYLKEVEKVRNFSWDDWRKRFLRFMNHKKSRLTDLFRKMDKNNDGLIPREDFINGIMNTKFDTSRLEMNAVADLVDPEGTGLIDWKKFIAALRPDWEEKPASEAEKIHDEVKRLVMLCTCRQKFRVFQVGEGKYRFGDSQKLRLVRILRSTVMVRVGGGWVALDEFLVKNDPCRAKGRTNIELREQFILAEGVSQSMSAFKPKHSASSTPRPANLQTSTGPIVKIRERTNRSIPLNKSGLGYTVGTPDSLSDNESSPCTPRTPVRKAATPTFRSSHGGSLPGSRANSRPASRQGSKPPSRHGSNLSLDSTDDGTPSRIPRRSTPSSRSSISGPTSTSSGARKLTSPAMNGTLSRTRSPSGLASPSSDKSKTPSGTSTPVSTGTSRLTRKPSGASDVSSKRGSKTPTPIEARAPFRL